jgi:DMSO/TMAO reductase YedYZ molybdopterin-dependent catalytic subunit
MMSACVVGERDMRRERGLSELFQDPERAQALLFSRRRFVTGGLTGTALLALQARLGTLVPYARFLPAGYLPVALAEGTAPIDSIQGGLRVLNDRPLNAETPAYLLDDLITPAGRLFVRNNGLPPENADPSRWRLEVSGEACLRPSTFSIEDLKRRFETYTYQLQLECGGNGRAEFRPRVPGNQWTTGAVGNPAWSGVRVKDVLEACGVADNAVYLGYLGADHHLSGDPHKAVISRGVPMAKALEDESLIAFAMNGEDIPAEHGAPLRLVCGGWPGSVSGKWLSGLLVRDRVHDGAKMTGTSYRVPCHPVAPGQSVPDEDMCIIESMPVKSLVTFPRSGIQVASNTPFPVRGKAWAGDRSVRAVATSIDFGETWQSARLAQPANRLAWQPGETAVTLPGRGYYEIWVRATDDAGVSQPMLVPGWNPKGYLNNATHRIAVQAS